MRRASLEHVPENDRRLSLGATADTNVGLRQLFSIIEMLRADVAKVREFQNKNALSSKQVAHLTWLANKARATVGDDASETASEQDPVHV